MRTPNSTKAVGLIQIKSHFGKNNVFFSKRSQIEKNEPSDIFVDDILQRLNNSIYPSRLRQKKIQPPPGIVRSITTDDGSKSSQRKRPKSETIISIDNSDDDDEEVENETQDNEEGITLSDLMNCITKVYQSDPYRSAKVFVVGFDKSNLVPSAKSEEQAKRTKYSKVDIASLKPIDFNNIDVPIKHFHDYLLDRTGWRRKIIKWICIQLLDENSEFAIRPILGKTFIIDGHTFTLDEMNSINELNGIDCISDDKEAYITPISIMSIRKPDRTIVRTIQVEPNLSNKIGECDHLPFFYLNYSTKGLTGKSLKTLEIISNDSDSTYISIAYLYNVRKCFDVTNSNLNSLPRIIIQKKTKGKVEWIHVNQLYDNILEKKINPMNLLVVLFSSGSDYTDSHHYVTYKRFIDAYLQNHENIGNLFEYDYEKLKPRFRSLKPIGSQLRIPKRTEQLKLYSQFIDNVRRTDYIKKEYYPDGWILADDFSLNAKAYVRLLLFAYCEAFRSRFTDCDASNLKPSTINWYLDGSSGKKTLSRDKFFPPIEDLRNSFLQVVYYMRLVISSGLPVISVGGVLEYGYKKLDITRGIVAGNIVKIREQ